MGRSMLAMRPNMTSNSIAPSAPAMAPMRPTMAPRAMAPAAPAAPMPSAFGVPLATGGAQPALSGALSNIAASGRAPMAANALARK